MRRPVGVNPFFLWWGQVHLLADVNAILHAELLLSPPFHPHSE